MGIVDSITDWVQDIRETHHERRRARRRRREAGVKPGDKVRDGLTDRLLRVENISESRANEYLINGVPLPEYGQNTPLDCDADIVVECRSPNSDVMYAYPASRIIPLEISTGEYARDRYTGDVLTVKRIRDTVAADQ